MTAVDMKGLHKVNAKGKTYYYAWRGGPRVRGEPGSKEFLANYLKLTKRQVDDKKIEGLVAAYKGSEAYRALAESTRRNWGPWLDHVRDGLGKLSIASFDRPEIRQVIKRWRNKWKDTPRAADTGKQVLSAMLSYAVEEGMLGTNPCFGISNLYSVDRAEIIWTQDDIDRLTAVCSREVAWALRLACLTGLRKSDLLKLSWTHVGSLSIDMNTGKSRGRKSAVVPLYAELRDLLAEIPRRATTVLTNSDGRPWRSGFSSSWNKAKIAAGETVLHFHDARGTAATKFYLAGFAPEEIAEILAWEKEKVERIINRYVRRDALLRQKIERLDAAARNGQ